MIGGAEDPSGLHQPFAKITPIQDQQPDVLTRDLGRKDKADPNEALFQVLTSYLYQRHEDQNGPMGGPKCFERLSSMSIVRPDKAKRQEDTGTKYPT